MQLLTLGAAAFATVANTSMVVALGAGDGPWAWRTARYDLYDGCIDEQQATTFSRSQLNAARLLGSVWRTNDDGQSQTFSWPQISEPDLTLSLTTFGEGGRGAEVWDAAIAILNFLRSDVAPVLPPHARVLELGAGNALPSFDLARRAGHVTITDAVGSLFSLARRNERTIRASHLSAGITLAPIEIAELRWGDVRMENATGLLRQQPPATSTSADASAASTHAQSELPVAGHDLVFGSDVAYDEAGAVSLASMLPQLDAAVVLIVGPAVRAAMHVLTRTLEARLRAAGRAAPEEARCANGTDDRTPTGGWRMETRKLTLVVSDATDGREHAGERVRSAGVHQVVLLTRQASSEVGATLMPL